MSFIVILCFSIAFFIALSYLINKSDLFSPARLFIFIWSLLIGLTELKLSWLQKEWENYSWIMLLICISAMLLGMFSVYVINFNRSIKSIDEIRYIIKNYSFDSNRMFKVVIYLFLAYIISYAIIYFTVGFIPLFTNDPNNARTKWSIFGFGLIIHSAPAVIYFALLFFLFIKKEIATKLVLVIIILTTLTSFFLLLQRFTIVITIILVLVMLYYGTKKFKGSYLLTIFSILVLLIYSISTIRTSRFFILYLYKEAKMKFDRSLAFLTEPYMYLVMNLENFANSVKQYEAFTYGYFTFDFIWALTGLKHPIAKAYYYEEFPFIVNKSFNTYTMFFVYYRDFGVFGLLIFPYLIGFAIASIYYWMRKSPSIYSISIYGMCVFVILFTFFIPMLSWLHFVMNISIIFMFSKYLLNKNVNHVSTC